MTDKLADALNDEKYYLFNDGTYVQGASFEDVKRKKITAIESEIENPERWEDCDCVGFQHRYKCRFHPTKTGEIPF